MIQITKEQLLAITPACKNPGVVVGALNSVLRAYGALSSDRDHVCAFIAQLAVESNQFNATRENMNYSAEGLMKTWPKRFPTLELAQRYARRPEAIANYVYANRLGNRDAASGDGWRNRGAGWIQCTGATNIRQALEDIGLSPDSDPTVLESPVHSAMSAGAYWNRKPQLNALADDLPDDDDAADFFSITRLINGGSIGIQERRLFWERAKLAIPA